MNIKGIFSFNYDIYFRFSMCLHGTESVEFTWDLIGSITSSLRTATYKIRGERNSKQKEKIKKVINYITFHRCTRKF